MTFGDMSSDSDSTALLYAPKHLVKPEPALMETLPLLLFGEAKKLYQALQCLNRRIAIKDGKGMPSPG